MPKTDIELLSFLQDHNINFQHHFHKKLFSSFDEDEISKNFIGARCKSLFLKDKKDNYFLIVTLGKITIDLKLLCKKLNIKNLSFTDDQKLYEHLGVTPGSVTPFALINANNNLNVILDQDMLSSEYLNYHPLRNDQTLTISKKDFIRFLELLNINYKILILPKKL